MKNNRQTVILEIIATEEIETQNQLMHALERHGIKTTQATLSRDIRDMHLTKETVPGGGYRYVSVRRDTDDHLLRLRKIFKESVVSYDIAQNLFVIRTLPGLASAACSAMDAMKVEGLVGTLAGDVEITEEDAAALAEAIYDGYTGYAKENKKPDPSLLADTFSEYLNKSETQEMVRNGILASITNLDEIQARLAANISAMMQGYASQMETAIAGGVQNMMNQMSYALASTMTSKMSQFSGALADAFHVDAGAFENAIQVNMDEDSMRDLFMSMMSTEKATYDGNMRKLGYADLSEPYTVSIYPRDFDAKAEVLRILDNYNDDMENSGQEDKIVSYTDVVGTLMSSVTTIIDTISYVLIAFVAVSLIVSSIMIGIITYISVLERIKEIGILRAIGASKRNISDVFNAETFIIGLLAGLLGVGVTLVLLVPINAVIHNVSGNPNINAFLPFEAGVILVIISVVLTLIGGLIPARSAANKDPVEALRSE